MMSDSGWLRAFGHRSSNAPLPALSGSGNPGKEPPHSQPHSFVRLRPPGPVRRVSSLLRLDLGASGPSHREGISGIAAPSPSPTTDGAADGTDSSLDGIEEPTITIREEDRTWSNPSLNQVVEALQVAMMTKRDALLPIPAHYNWHVLTLIEGYADQRRRITELETEVAKLRKTGEGERQEFRTVAQEWSQREETYRAEMRRLELIIAKTSRNGMETVALARSGSLVDRGGRKSFQDRLKRLSNSQDYDEGNYEISKAESQTRTVKLSRTMGSFRTIDSIPRTIDPNQDTILSERLLQDHSSVQDPRLSYRQSRLTRPEVVRQHSIHRRASYIFSEGSESSSHGNIQEDDSDITLQPGQGMHYEMGIDSSPSSSTSSSESPASQRNHGVWGQLDEKEEPKRDRAGPRGVGDFAAAHVQATNYGPRRFSFNAGDDKVLTFSPPKIKVW